MKMYFGHSLVKLPCLTAMGYLNLRHSLHKCNCASTKCTMISCRRVYKHKLSLLVVVGLKLAVSFADAYDLSVKIALWTVVSVTVLTINWEREKYFKHTPLYTTANYGYWVTATTPSLVTAFSLVTRTHRAQLSTCFFLCGCACMSLHLSIFFLSFFFLFSFLFAVTT